MAEQVIFDGPEYTVYEDKRPGVTTRRVEPKPGSTIANREDLAAKASQALSANDTYLAIASPTNAQNAAQVQRLTRECNALIRLCLAQFDSTNGT